MPSASQECQAWQGGSSFPGCRLSRCGLRSVGEAGWRDAAAESRSSRGWWWAGGGWRSALHWSGQASSFGVEVAMPYLCLKRAA